jgi:hypothetical protein
VQIDDISEKRKGRNKFFLALTASHPWPQPSKMPERKIKS